MSDFPMWHRPRRNRRTASIRNMVRETELSAHNFVYPLFVQEGKDQKNAIKSMPGQFRLSRDLLIKKAREAFELGIPAVALFPVIPENKKDPMAKAAMDREGLLPQTVKALKDALPELCVITDVAMDPYSTDGHDGIVKDGEILNDETLEVLGEMALCQAEAGADYVAPSDMMDGRVGHLREVLDESGHTQVGIISYAAKYASAYYGPFREALDSAPKFGDKKTYQMDPANVREALREVKLDLREGADMVMVKPALAYLDVIARIRRISTVPVAAYNVSGEYAMVHAAANSGWLDLRAAVLEKLLAIKRAGASVIFTYSAIEAARWLQD